MKFDFTDSNGVRYECELDAEPEIASPHAEITVYRRPDSAGSTTIRPIVDGKIKWWYLDDDRMVSLEARVHLDRIIKNKVFL